MASSFQISSRGLLLLVAACALLAWLGRAANDAREAAKRMTCNGQLCQLGLALHNYHDAYGSFPPAYVADAQGKAMHSWRVLILPFIEEQPLYARYNFNEPWNGPNNSKLAASMPHIFACPSHRGDFRDVRYRGTHWTSYVVVVGAETVFPGAQCVSLADIRDEKSQTVLLVEVSNENFHWMEPRDLGMEQLKLAADGASRRGISSKHGTGAHLVMADGSRVWLRNGSKPDGLRAMMTRAGGEHFNHDQGD